LGPASAAQRRICSLVFTDKAIKASFFAIEKAPAHKDRRHKCCGIKLLLRSRNQRLLNLCGADDVLLIFQSLRFRIEIITQNRRFRKSFDKIAAFVTKIDYMPCFFCASFPEKAADIPVFSPQS